MGIGFVGPLPVLIFPCYRRWCHSKRTGNSKYANICTSNPVSSLLLRSPRSPLSSLCRLLTSTAQGLSCPLAKPITSLSVVCSHLSLLTSPYMPLNLLRNILFLRHSGSRQFPIPLKHLLIKPIAYILMVFHIVLPVTTRCRCRMYWAS